jgi:sarcosine oxidase
MAAETADVVVIGLGAVGAATLHRLALRGVRAVGIDRFHPPHDRGSTHGESRITRLAVGEGPAYAPLVRRSHEIWRELEAETGDTLFLRTGGLIMGPRDGAAQHHGKGDFVRRTAAVARDAGVAHEVLDAAEIAARFPQFVLRGDEIGCFEPSAGVVFPERCVAAQLRLAGVQGAVLHLGEAVTAIRPAAGGVEVRTDRRVLHAARAVLCAGPWLPGLAGGRLAALARVHRQTLHWFAVDDAAAYAPERFPVFIWMHGDSDTDYFYGFPCLSGAGPATVKLATEQYAATVDPDRSERRVEAAESADMHARHVAGRLRGVGPACVRAAACLYTVTPDSGFIVDALPEQPNVLAASACSGHGFKHSAALGEMLAARAAAAGPHAPGAFDVARFGAMAMG